ncbi:ft [Trypoxylus dichotomus]
MTTDLIYDSQGLQYKKSKENSVVKVTVKDKNDSPPSFSDTPLKFSVSEDLSPGLYVATIKANDPDTLGQLQYSLISGSDNHFALDPDTGVLTLVDPLDRETKELYKLTVRASDGIQSTDTTVVIQVSIKMA